MKNMFHSYPIEIQTKCMDEDSLIEQINRIKNLKEVGFDFSFFFDVLSNAHNGTSIHQKNNYTLVEWEEHFLNNSINAKLEQIEIMFNYLMMYHQGILSYINNRYILQKSPEKENFGLELVVFKSLEN